jgi:hypothetical protein
MASSRRTYDTDFITLRTVYAKNADNSVIPALRALTANGLGGTTWLQPSSFGTNPSFNQIITTGGTYTADLSFNTFRLFAGDGVGMANGDPGSNQTYIYSKAFNQIDVSGGDTLKAFSNDILTPSVKFAAGQNSYVQLRTDSDTNTFFIDGPMTQTISTGYYGFNKFVIIPTVSTIQTDLSAYPRKTLFADSQSTQITFAGVGDLLLSTNYSTNQVFFSVSSFTAAGYLALSGEAFTVYNRLLSTISSGFVTVPQFSTGAISLSTNSFSNASTVNSSILGVSSYFATRFDILTGLINARATIVQLNEVTGNFQVSLSSFSTNYVSYVDYISSATGILNQVSTTLFLSDISTVYLYGGLVSQFSAGTILYDQSDISTLSTATNTRIISTASNLALQNQGNLVSTFSTILGLGTLGYVSSTQLFSTVAGLGTLGYISSQQLFSTVEGLGSIGYVSTSQLQSTVRGLGTLGYISTSYTDVLLQSTTAGINNHLGSLGYISSASLTSTLQSTTQGLTNNLGSLGYVSTASFESTTIGLYNTMGQVYVSTSGLNTILQSSIQGLGTLGYISTATLDLAVTSSFEAVFRTNLVSTPSLQSTINNLGTTGYVSTATYLSSFNNYLLQVKNFRSSITYVGNSGALSGAPLGLPNDDIYFSSATMFFDVFSSFVRTTSKISFDANVNVFFPGPAVAVSPPYIPISTFLQYKTLIVPTTTYTDFHYISGSSNVYSKMITMQIDPSFLTANYTSPYTLAHRITSNIGNIVSAKDVFSLNCSIYMASTNSLFFTLQTSLL